MIDTTKRGQVTYLQSSSMWPLLLIGLGVFWLLRSFNIFSNANLAMLVRLWPLLLIIVGADILLRRDSRQLDNLVVFGGLALIVVLVITGPALGLWQVTVRTLDKVEAIDSATSATITVNLAGGTNTVGSVTDAQTLFKTNMTYLGDVNYSASGTPDKKVIKLDNRASNIDFWDSFSADLHTNIGLSPEVPLSLSVSNGSGAGTFNLNTLKLTDLSVVSGSGLVTANLPASPDQYTATFTGGSGIQTINIPANAALNLDVTGGSGASRITIGSDAALNLNYEGGSGMLFVDIPDGTAVHIEASAGSGAVFVSGVPCASDTQCHRDSGVWETADYTTAAHKIYIHASLGSGTVTIK